MAYDDWLRLTRTRSLNTIANPKCHTSKWVIRYICGQRVLVVPLSALVYLNGGYEAYNSIAVGFYSILWHWGTQPHEVISVFCRLHSHLNVWTLSPWYFRVGPMWMVKHPTNDLDSWIILEPDTKHTHKKKWAIFLFSLDICLCFGLLPGGRLIICSKCTV